MFHLWFANGEHCFVTIIPWYFVVGNKVPLSVVVASVSYRMKDSKDGKRTTKTL